MRNTNFILDVYDKKNINSKLSTQLLFGEQFTILKKYKNWLKIKSFYDGYIGFVKKKNFKPDSVSTHKVKKISANLYKAANKNSKIRQKIYFCSLIKVIKKKNNFYKFDNYWINKNDLSNLKNNKISRIFSKVKIFDNVTYKWGGVSAKGIDCSSLVQIFFKYNNKFFPRDTKDQIKFFKKQKKIKKFKKDDIIFWRGHVAICLNKDYLIHAYGPKKKVLKMPINQTIKLIKKTARLKIIKIDRPII